MAFQGPSRGRQRLLRRDARDRQGQRKPFIDKPGGDFLLGHKPAVLLGHRPLHRPGIVGQPPSRQVQAHGNWQVERGGRQAKDTATWQLSFLLLDLASCLCTPTDCDPFLGISISARVRITGPTPEKIVSRARLAHADNNRPSSQGLVLMKCWSDWAKVPRSSVEPAKAPAMPSIVLAGKLTKALR